MWKSADKAPLAAEAMGIIGAASERTEAYRFHHSGAAGGAHRNPEVMAASLKAQLLEDLADLDVLSTDDFKKPSLPSV
ncbi:acetyl-coenzyme A carboxylase carboxyl transferase subunit alpha [Salmonella enterica subsp. salamae]|uniref:Acetyl-coenzyme A carboxylase carboxyl transferase subunit alpha n=1 Tax=Salmonella enterica subsp. salamae TaxID=59202 RepID=A0A6D2GBX1_SALER|nr:acetyl-coenzyme A carboxylase carboxyl transferase subunit alpha [Salmonella enterica subsp. salamae]